jgi:hypothetical protein
MPQRSGQAAIATPPIQPLPRLRPGIHGHHPGATTVRPSTSSCPKRHSRSDVRSALVGCAWLLARRSRGLPGPPHEGGRRPGCGGVLQEATRVHDRREAPERRLLGTEQFAKQHEAEDGRLWLSTTGAERFHRCTPRGGPQARTTAGHPRKEGWGSGPCERQPCRRASPAGGDTHARRKNRARSLRTMA